MRRDAFSPIMQALCMPLHGAMFSCHHEQGSLMSLIDTTPLWAPMHLDRLGAVTQAAFPLTGRPAGSLHTELSTGI